MSIPHSENSPSIIRVCILKSVTVVFGPKVHSPLCHPHPHALLKALISDVAPLGDWNFSVWI